MRKRAACRRAGKELSCLGSFTLKTGLKEGDLGEGVMFSGSKRNEDAEKEKDVRVAHDPPAQRKGHQIDTPVHPWALKQKMV